MNKRIRINGKLYEAVATPVETTSNTKDDLAGVKRLAKYASAVDVVNKKSADTVYDVAIDLLDKLSTKSLGYDRTAIRRAIKILRNA